MTGTSMRPADVVPTAPMTGPHALVVFDSRHGHTFRVAEALARGLGRAGGVATTLLPYFEVTPDHLDAAQLIVIGGPTEAFSASGHIKKFFGHIGAYDLHGKYGFAYDTHAPGALQGSAARWIEKELKIMGVRPLRPRSSALVLDHRGGAPGDDPLELAPEAVTHFEALGEELGRTLVAALREHPMVRSTDAEWKP